MPAARPDYLEDFDRTCRVRIEGVDFDVPENNTVLRVLQYLEDTQRAFELIYKEFCWNADCHNCQFAYRENGVTMEALGCCHKVTEGLEIVRLPKPVFRCAPRPDRAPER